MTYAVTGATGPLGANLVRELIASGRDVRVITAEPLDVRPPALQGLDVARVHADVRDAASVRRAIAGAEVVYHLAARISIVDWDADEVWAVNVRGTGNVVDACVANDVRRLVHVSSYHSFSPAGNAATTESGPASVGAEATPYARSKAFGEQMVDAGIEQGLDAVIVNPTGMIGPWDTQPSMMGRLLVDMWRGRVPALLPGGFNVVDVRDVAKTLVGAELRGTCGSRYLVGGSWVSIEELAELACQLIGKRPPRMKTPMWLVRAIAPFASRVERLLGRPARMTDQALRALTHHRLVLDGRAREELGHRSRPIEHSLADTYDWFAAHGALSDARPAAVTTT
jgi:dihydroflavonol-4-reductase